MNMAAMSDLTSAFTQKLNKLYIFRGYLEPFSLATVKTRNQTNNRQLNGPLRLRKLQLMNELKLVDRYARMKRDRITT